MAGDYVLAAHDNQNYFDQQGVNGERTPRLYREHSH